MRDLWIEERGTACTFCGVEAGEPCVVRASQRVASGPHVERWDAWRRTPFSRCSEIELALAATPTETEETR